MQFIEILEKEIDIKAVKEYLPMQSSDVKNILKII